MIRKKILIFGHIRSGNHLLKDYFYRALKYKKKKEFNINKKIFFKEFENGDNFKYINKKFYLYTPWNKNNFKRFNKKRIFQKTLLNTHYFDPELFDIFKQRKKFLIFRDPIETLSSLIQYTTKKNVLAYSKKYKIADKNILLKNKAFINKSINDYVRFNNNFFKFKNDIIFLNYNNLISKLNDLFKVRSYNYQNQKDYTLHSTKKSKFIKKYLIKNYNFDKPINIYKKLVELTN